jgi:small conductance mechanosensitive channel
MNSFFQQIATRIGDLFAPAALGTMAGDMMANAVVGIITFSLYYLAWRVLERLMRLGAGRASVDQTTREFSLAVVRLVLLTGGVVHALASFGVNTASLIASLGVAGLTIGFAAKDALSNLIAGLLIYWDRPFVIGDLLEVGPHYGRVDRITLRSTRVITPDGRMLAVPNTEIINTTVASYTNFPHLRLDIPITIGVNEDVGRVRRLLLDLVRADSAFMADPEPAVVVVSLNDYNLQIELQAWAENERVHIRQRHALREAAYRTLHDAGVEMPFETLRIEPVTVLSAAS